jgi:ABC-type transporter Mla subunit MlaD
MSEVFVLGLVAVLGLIVLGLVALVLGRGFRGEVSRDRVKLETQAERRDASR